MCTSKRLCRFTADGVEVCTLTLVQNFKYQSIACFLPHSKQPYLPRQKHMCTGCSPQHVLSHWNPLHFTKIRRKLFFYLNFKEMGSVDIFRSQLAGGLKYQDPIYCKRNAHISHLQIWFSTCLGNWPSPPKATPGHYDWTIHMFFSVRSQNNLLEI